jgi:hypothetical protein
MLDIHSKASIQNFLFFAAFVDPDFRFGSSEPIEPGPVLILITTSVLDPDLLIPDPDPAF